MTVNDLIRILAICDLDAEVVIRGYEGGVDSVSEVLPVEIYPNVNIEWYYGKHEIVSHTEKELEDVKPKKALLLRG